MQGRGERGTGNSGANGGAGGVDAGAGKVDGGAETFVPFAKAAGAQALAKTLEHRGWTF